MNYLIVGLGNIGKKRKTLLGERCIYTADPYQPDADFRQYADAPPEKFDAVILSGPNHVKIEQLTHFLKLRKHVLVEKPLLFPDDFAASELKSLSKQTGAIWYTSYNHRFEPLIQRMKKLLDEGAVGTIYKARLLYGNGTVRNNIGNWREEGYGILDDLGCHLIDLTCFLFGELSVDYLPWDLRRIESKNYDYGLLAAPGRRIVLEFGSIFWKNTFAIEVLGERGSLHLSGLCKWGGSELLIRSRVFPSGAPIESQETATPPDPTWAKDLEEFEHCAAEGRCSYENDLRINRSMQTAARHWLEQEAERCGE
ncbi:MAG: Gfo/Idh/MocA family oxidoreductase [Candidatus Omnitrophota bacterium]